MKMYAMSVRESVAFLLIASLFSFTSGYLLHGNISQDTAKRVVVVGIPAPLIADKALESVDYTLQYFPAHIEKWRESVSVTRNGVRISVASPTPGAGFSKILEQLGPTK